MFETVTVDDAIKRGQRTLIIPVLIIILGGIALSIYLGIENIITARLAIITGAASFIAACIYWGVKAPKWRAWAFDNVRNVHELETRAIEANLIWEKHSDWNATEIWRQGDREKWNSLQKKFEQEDIFADDYAVATETVIYYSRKSMLIATVVALVALGVVIYFACQQDSTSATFSALAVIAMGFSVFKRFRNKTVPQIILNAKGIETSATTLIAWNKITDEKVITETRGEDTVTYLEYFCPHGREEFDIAGLDVSKQQLRHLLQIYRARSEKAV